MESSPSPAYSIEARAALLLQLRRAGVRDIGVLRAIETVPRELFVPHRFQDLAARNMALPIGCGQTIEAPAVLARRLEALAVEPHHRVLEVGTGSGFSAAVLTRLAAEVVTIERFETLAIEAAKRLAALAIVNARVLFADGLAASPSLGPFDRAILHMSIERAPQAVLDVLIPGGVMIFGRHEASADAGRPGERLLRLERDARGAFRETDLGPCRQGAALDGAALAL